MASSTEHFEELLGSESYVDMNKLREWSFHGIPDPVRGAVWMFLLEICSPDRSQELKMRKTLAEDYQELLATPSIYSVELRRLHSQIQRYAMCRDGFRDQTVLCDSLQSVISSYQKNNPKAPYEPKTIGLAGPIVYVMKEPYEAYFSFESLMSKLDEQFPPEKMASHVSQFTMLFRAIHPELYEYLEDEEVDFCPWVTSWLRYLLSWEIGDMSCVLRLWDTYFSCDEGLGLHIYVCLAILVECHEVLIEFENSEVMGFLQHLPPMDMDQIIMQAYNIRGEVYARDLI